MTGATITVIEGLDGVGKSYAADRRWARESTATGQPAIGIHNGPPPRFMTSRRLFRRYLGQLQRAVKNRDDHGQSTIIDRSWPSEVVYGVVYRGGSLLTPHQVNRLERYAAKHDIITVAIEAPPIIRKVRIEDRGETWSGTEQVALEAGYFNYFQSHPGWTTVSSSLA